MKKNIIVDNLSLNHAVVSVLDDTPMMYVINTNDTEAQKGPRKSNNAGGAGHCKYSDDYHDSWGCCVKRTAENVEGSG